MFVTLWYLKNKNGEFQYNHFEENMIFELGDYPLPIREEFKNQRSWKNGTWIKKQGVLEDGEVITLNESKETCLESGELISGFLYMNIEEGYSGISIVDGTNFFQAPKVEYYIINDEDMYLVGKG
jgi:hypothetical protein